jgi:hypothetical protein
LCPEFRGKAAIFVRPKGCELAAIGKFFAAPPGAVWKKTKTFVPLAGGRPGKRSFHAFEKLAADQREVRFDLPEADFFAPGAFGHVSVQMTEFTLGGAFVDNQVGHGRGDGDNRAGAKSYMQKNALRNSHRLNKGAVGFAKLIMARL